MSLKQDKDYLIAEVLLKLTAIERLLVKSNVINSTELVNEMEKISKEVVDFLKAKQLEPRDQEN